MGKWYGFLATNCAGEKPSHYIRSDGRLHNATGEYKAICGRIVKIKILGPDVERCEECERLITVRSFDTQEEKKKK